MTLPQRSQQPEGLRLPASLNLTDDVESELRGQLWRYALLDQLDDAVELLEDEMDEWGVDEGVIESAAQHVRRARSEQQAGWNDLATSNVRDAFDELATIGVVARAHFSCCGTCASGEIWDERDDSRPWRGYVYFHMQDTEQLIEDRTTYLGYGAFLDAWMSEDEWNAVPEDQRDERYSTIVRGLMEDEVFPVLTRHGLAVSWDGDLGRRILIENADYFVEV